MIELRFDPWEVDYGPETALSPEDDAPELVDASVEVDPAAWRPILPGAVDVPRRLLFLDGIRRVEARVSARVGTRTGHGAFGAWAIGAVEVSDGAARFATTEVHRLLALDSGLTREDDVTVGPGLVYRPVSTALTEPDAPLRKLQEQMRLGEEALGRELANEPETLVVADGPLTFGDPVRGGAVGFIKRLMKLYVDAPLVPVLASLPPGGRTPLFALRGTARFSRYSWFLRLAAPFAGETELSGLIRLEVADSIGLDAARHLADATASLLPRFAPSRGRDPRSPQNLLPVGALESHLRKLLGDPRLVRQRIRSYLAREAA